MFIPDELKRGTMTHSSVQIFSVGLDMVVSVTMWYIAYAYLIKTEFTYVFELITYLTLLHCDVSVQKVSCICIRHVISQPLRFWYYSFNKELETHANSAFIDSTVYDMPHNICVIIDNHTAY